MPDSAAKYIKENGGLLRFRYSNNYMPASLKNKDGSRMTHQQWWDANILPRLTPQQKDELNDVFTFLRNTTRMKGDALNSARANKETYFKQQKEAEEKSAQEWKEKIQSHAQKVLTTYGDAAKLKTIDPKDTPEVKAEKELHNKRYHQAEAIANKYLTQITPENLTEAAIGMGYLSLMKEDMKALEARATTAEGKVKELTTQLEGIKKSGQVGRKITIHEPAKETTTKAVGPRRLGQTSDEAAMEELVKQHAENAL